MPLNKNSKGARGLQTAELHITSQPAFFFRALLSVLTLLLSLVIVQKAELVIQTSKQPLCEDRPVVKQLQSMRAAPAVRTVLSATDCTQQRGTYLHVLCSSVLPHL